MPQACWAASAGTLRQSLTPPRGPASARRPPSLHAARSPRQPLTSSPGVKFSWHRGHRFASFSALAAETVSMRQDLVTPVRHEWRRRGTGGQGHRQTWDLPPRSPSRASGDGARVSGGCGGTHGCSLSFLYVWAALPLKRPHCSGNTPQSRPFCHTPSAGAPSGWKSPPPGSHDGTRHTAEHPEARAAPAPARARASCPASATREGRRTPVTCAVTYTWLETSHPACPATSGASRGHG